MKRFAYIVIGLFFLTSSSLFGQAHIEIIQAPELVSLTKPSKQGVKVVNFWATWCKPCIKEIPYFVNAMKAFPEVEFIFISLDFADQVEKVNKFTTLKGMDNATLYLIDDLDYNSWIDKVSSEWTGAIPATLIISNGSKALYEKEFHEGELQKILSIKSK